MPYQKQIKEPVKNQYLIGHDLPIEIIEKMVQNNNLHHSLLLSGRKAIGKFSLAFRFSYNLINKSDYLFQPPDLSSKLWHQMQQNTCHNFLYISKTYDETTKKLKQYITIDKIITIKKFLNFNSTDYKIIIIDAIDDLNLNAANAILKILEEPPKNTLFILIYHKSSILLPTIKSRSIAINFMPLSPMAIIDALEHCLEIKDFAKDKAAIIAPKAHGSVGKACELYLTSRLELEEAFIKNIDKLNICAIQTLVEEGDNTQLKEILLDYIADKAMGLINKASISEANKLCLFWKELNYRFKIVAEYNLDIKQELFNIIIEIYNLKQSNGYH